MGLQDLSWLEDGRVYLTSCSGIFSVTFRIGQDVSETACTLRTLRYAAALSHDHTLVHYRALEYKQLPSRLRHLEHRHTFQFPHVRTQKET
jgi:hypothetical protein